MWENVKVLVLGSDPLSLSAQLAFLIVITLLHVLQIVKMRRDSVVVLSWGRLVLACVAVSLANLGFFRLVVHYRPTKWWGWVLVFVAMAVWAIPVNLLALGVAGKRCLRDTAKTEAESFNCNWPLIRRCAMQSLTYLLMLLIVIVSAKAK